MELFSSVIQTTPCRNKFATTRRDLQNCSDSEQDELIADKIAAKNCYTSMQSTIDNVILTV